MHSRKKIPKDEVKEHERMKKATKFSNGLKKILQLKKDGCKDVSLLSGIAELLIACPDFFTLWNYRREILIALKEELALSENDEDKLQEFNQRTKNELTFTENCLRVNYKSYGTWHHRCWLLTFMNNPNLEREFELCNQFFQMDERNFHCWNYRRFIVQLSKVDPLLELEFSSKLILVNFSNFSSWYYRSSLLKLLYANGHDPKLIQSYLDNDYRRIESATFVEPTDQSVWLYLRWLFNIYSKGLQYLVSQKCFSCNKVNRFVWTSTEVEGEYIFAIELANLIDSIDSLSVYINDIFVLLPPFIQANDSVWYTKVKYENIFENGSLYRFTLKSKDDSILEVTFNHSRKDENENFVCFTYNFETNFEAGSKIDSEKYESLKTLLEMEPDNKWVNFTLAWLESNDDAMDDIIDKLIQIDHLRTNYYKDLRSKIMLNKFFQSNQCDLHTNLHVSLSNLKLHSLRDMNRLMHIQYLDISHNEIIKLGTTFSSLVSLRCLILDSNSIYIVDDKLHLPNLTILSLSNNRINKLQMIVILLSNCAKLKHLALFDNPLVKDVSLMEANLKSEQFSHLELAIYWERSNENEKDISNIISKERKSIQSRNKNEFIHKL